MSFPNPLALKSECASEVLQPGQSNANSNADKPKNASDYKHKDAAKISELIQKLRD